MQGVFGTPLRGMVLCAGLGTRMGALSDEVPLSVGLRSRCRHGLP